MTTLVTRAGKGSGLTNVEIDANFTGLNSDINARQRKHGFEVGSDGSRLAAIAYNSATRILTISPTGPSSVTFDFYIDGVKFTKNGVQTATAHAAASGRYFYYYDDEGNLQVSTTPWSIVDRTVTSVAFVFYNHDIANGIPMVELHGADRWLEGHKNLHFTQGTRKLSGFGLSGFSLNTDTDAAVTFGVDSGQIADEDLVTSVSSLSDGGPYTVLYRTGANGDWTWDSTPVYPFLAGATYPQYNEYTGATWQMTELSGVGGGTWCNYFLFAVPSVDAATQLLLVPGQVQHASLSAAQAEGVSGIAWGTMPFEEIAPLYKITLQARGSFTNTYNVQIVGVTEILAGGASVITSSSPSVHNSLSSRDADDAHPASAITNTPTGDIVATTVQAAIDELEAEKVPYTAYNAHTDVDAIGAHQASNISFSNVFYDNVQAAVDGFVSDLNGEIGGHVGDTTEAHYATAIGFSSTAGLAATDVSAALDELASEKVQKAGDSMSGALQIAGTSTPTGSGLELHLISSEGYVQAYNRTGSAWLNLLLRGLVVQLWAAGGHKGGVDANGMYGVALSKAGDPDTTEIPAGVWRVAKNTSSGAVKLWYNDGGTLKSVALS